MPRDRARNPLRDCEPEALQPHGQGMPRVLPWGESIEDFAGRIPRRSFCLMSLAVISLFFFGRPRSVQAVGLSRRPAMYVWKESVRKTLLR